MLDASASVVNGMSDCAWGVSVRSNLYRLCQRRLIPMEKLTYHHISVGGDRGDGSHLFRRELNVVQLVSGRRYTTTSHDFDKVGTCPDLLPGSFHAIWNAVADTTKISVGATTALVVVMRTLQRSTYASHILSLRQLLTLMSPCPPVCDRA